MCVLEFVGYLIRCLGLPKEVNTIRQQVRDCSGIQGSLGFRVQGNLAHKKLRPPRTLQQDYA